MIRKKAFLVLMSVCLFLGCRPVLADDDSEILLILDTPPNSPAISTEMEKGDLVEYQIRIKNAYQTQGKVGLYPIIYEVDKNGMYTFYDSKDLTSDEALSRWISFPRGPIELNQGDEVIHKLEIRPSPDAKEGDYRAVVVLGQGSTQSGAAEAAQKYNVPTININIKIKSHTIERVEVSGLGPATPILTKSPLEFVLKVKNIGNVPTVPRGELVLYTKNGKELASATLDGSQVMPEEVKSFPIKVEYIGSPGKYKAKFIGQYGADNKDLQDLIYFLYLPVVVLVIIVVLILFVLIWLTIVIGRRRQRSDKQGDERGYVINLRK